MPHIPQPILDAIKENRLILWVGAGFSQQRLGLPSWFGLVNELADICLPTAEAAALKHQLKSEEITVVNAIELLQPYAEKCHNFIRDRFTLKMERWDERLEDFHTLWQISHKIITTNYDNGLDLTQPGSVPPPVVRDKKYQRKWLIEGEKFYFKLHGSASEPDNCILFESQYQQLYRDISDSKILAFNDEDTPAKYLLKYLLTGHTVLFIGFGMEKSVDFTLSYIHSLLDGTEQPKFLLTKTGDSRIWQHTQLLTVGDWSDVPELLRALAQKKAECNPSIVRGDIALSFDREYVGRDAEVDALEKFFRGNNNFFFLSGAGGMGKSHLLDTVLQRLSSEEQPVYFRIERYYTTLTITQKLGIDPVPPAPKNQPNQFLLNALERVGKSLVFDDFYEISDPELFYTLLELPKWRRIKSLIISRSLPPDWAKFDSNVLHRELRELDRSAFDLCLQGLASQMPAFENTTLSSQQLDACWQLCGGYPLGGHLLLSLFSEPDFDPAQIVKIDLANDPTRSHFVGRLLDAILKKGTDDERNLAREMAVFAEAVPETAFATLPSWKPDRIAFRALWERKGLVFRRKADNLFGIHALVRSMILQQLGESSEARSCAGHYYEFQVGLPDVERVVALQKALEHYDLSSVEDSNAFRERMNQSFVDINVVQLRTEHDSALAIERLIFRQQLNPSDVSAANELGMVYRRQGNLVKAIEVLQKAAKAGNIQSFNELGITFRDAGQRDKAIEVLQKAVDMGHIPSMNELGITLRDAGQRDKAIEVLQKAADLQPNNVILLNELGITLRDVGQQDKAIEILQKAVDAGHIHAMNELGITFRNAGQRDKAIEILQKAADLQPNNAILLNELGITLRNAGRLDKAIEVLQKAADAGNIHAMNELGITLRDAGQRDKAIEVLQKAADLQPNNVILLNELGITLRDAGQRDKAIEVLQKAADAGSIPSMNELGITLRDAGQQDRAIEVLQKAADAGSIHAMNELGITLRDAGQRDKAIEVLQKAADLQPNNIILLNELGITLRDAGQQDRAIEVLQKAADAGSIPSMNELGITLREDGQRDKAIQVIELSLKKYPDNTFFKRNLLQIHLFFKPEPNEANRLLEESKDFLKGIPAQIYPKVAEQLDVLLMYESRDFADYRQYINQLFYCKSWHFAVVYLSGLIQKYPRGEFKAKLGEALCKPIIGRISEGLPLIREAMEEFKQNPALYHYYQQTAVVFLEVLSQKGKKEFRRHYERLEPELRGYQPFESRRQEWEQP